jgi:hypothetical protein
MESAQNVSLTAVSFFTLYDKSTTIIGFLQQPQALTKFLPQVTMKWNSKTQTLVEEAHCDPRDLPRIVVNQTFLYASTRMKGLVVGYNRL